MFKSLTFFLGSLSPLFAIPQQHVYHPAWKQTRKVKYHRVVCRFSSAHSSPFVMTGSCRIRLFTSTRNSKMVQSSKRCVRIPVVSTSHWIYMCPRLLHGLPIRAYPETVSWDYCGRYGPSKHAISVELYGNTPLDFPMVFCNALSTIGNIFQDAGLKDICVWAGTEWSLSGVRKNYNWVTRVHK